MFRMMLTICILFAPLTTFANDRLPEGTVGIWHGVGLQADMASWSLEVRFDSDQVAKVHYPEVNCGGIWHYSSVSDARIIARESITYGHEFCLDGGIVWLDPLEGNLLAYRWFYPDGSLYAVAVLWAGEISSGDYDALLNFTRQTLGAELSRELTNKSTFRINQI